jgi:hypothetical protein
MDNQYSNPYTSTYAPSGFEQQNQQGMNPVFQNTNAQQQYLAGQLREQQALAQHKNPQQTQGSSMNPMDLAKMLKNRQSTQQPTNTTGAPVNDYSTQYNPATGQNWDVTGSGLAGNGGYDPMAMNGMNDYLGQMGMDTGGFSGAGDFGMSGAGDSLSGLGDMFSGIGGWFSGIDWAGISAGAGEVAAEAAPAAAAAA